MLDDLASIHNKDRSDALGFAKKQPEQLLHQFGLPDIDFGDILNVVVDGMGGSGLSARMVRTWPSIGLPFELVQDYDIPMYVGAKTLFIGYTYSGNTEETLEAVTQAEQKGAHITAIAARGRLAEIAKQKNFLFAQMPDLPQPRYAAFAGFRALVDILARIGAVRVDTYQDELVRAAGFLKQEVEAWGPEVPTAANPAKQLAQELLGKSVIVYAGPKLYPAAYKFKIALNENAKQVAWYGQLPEFCHNEFIGWSDQPIDKPYAVVDLRSSFEHPRNQKRFEVAERMLSGKRPAPHVVEARGSSALEQMLWTMVFGDFVSIYLALLNGSDPTPIDLVEKFKKALND